MDTESLDERTSLAEATRELAARQVEEKREARELAQRYGLELVDMAHFRIDNDLFRTIPFDLMLRYSGYIKNFEGSTDFTHTLQLGLGFQFYTSK